MNDQNQQDTEPDEEIAGQMYELPPDPHAGMPSKHLVYEDLMAVPLYLSAELGVSTMRVREVLALKKGSVVTLSKMAGEMTDLSINGLPLAKGEIVVIGDILHVRLSEITGMESVQEKIEG